ncbi:hypothetical protein EHQ53_08785 [Leptospira langatensis]|uniref:Uncharacterized protein n=1 Tax=Leptospira langatensis TaxID=2484983 RepID=A0A5F1ZX91_9LEPT|nr:hypothetical protein [Leptospira langatensis]TGK01276.1 hypothetical protein EHO57_10085 [Leptospira langatensis]TGL42271.1 hypothetical protein EHQ53_08785 [Leptospira langatensis]
MKKTILLTLCLTLGGAASILAQDNTQNVNAKEKMACERIELDIKNVTYNDALRCETKDAICYMIEGFSMSCIPKDRNPSNK